MDGLNYDFLKFIDQTWNVDRINILYRHDKSAFDINNILSIFPGAFFIYRKDEDEKIIGKL